jgi:hypothetical protein
MAIKAKVTAVNALPTGEAIAVDVDYYDDAAPSVILYRHAFEFAITLTLGQMQTAIQTLGAKVRSAIAKKIEKAAEFVGQEINIP